MEWTRNPDLERRLGELGMKWEYKRGVMLTSLKVEESKHNNARFSTPIDEEKCLEYAGAMESGAIFPAIVVKADGMILAGNNRVHAAQFVGEKSVDAYVVTEATAAAIEEFVRTDNITHGMDLTEEQKIRQIVHLHRKEGKPLQQLCNRFFGRRDMYARLLAAVHAASVREQLENCGVDPNKLEEVAQDTPSILADLYTLCPGDKAGIRNVKLLREAFHIIVGCGLNSAQVNEMIRAVKVANDEKEQLATLDEYERTHKKVKAKATPASTKFRMHMSGLYNVLTTGKGGNQFRSFSEFPITDEAEAKKLSGMMAEMINIFRDLKASMKKGK